MGGQVFKKDNAGIKSLLQSSECLKVMEKYAGNISSSGNVRPFIGYDRAKCFVWQKEKKK